MGKHDATGHVLHIPKEQKFKQPKPQTFSFSGTVPQAPKPGHSSHNMFK